MADVQVELKNENEQEIETEKVMHPAVFQQNQKRKGKGGRNIPLKQVYEV